MIKLNGEELELYIKNNNPTFGFISEFYENKMISGKIRRDYRGKRFNAIISFPYLTDEQIDYLNSLILNDNIYAEIDVPNDVFKGYVYADLNEDNVRYAYINNKWVWTNYTLSLTGVDLIEG